MCLYEIQHVHKIYRSCYKTDKQFNFRSQNKCVARLVMTTVNYSYLSSPNKTTVTDNHKNRAATDRVFVPVDC